MMTKNAAFACCVLAAVGCDRDPVDVTLTSDSELQIRPAMTRAVAGQALSLNAVAFSPEGTPVFTGPVAWRSLDPAVVSVDATGTVEVLTAGWGRIEARAVNGGQKDTAIVGAGLRLAGLTADRTIGCGWEADGTAYCWGSTTWGALGTGTREASLTPARVAGDVRFSSIDAGEQHTCGIGDGAVYCWGFSSFGAVGVTGCNVASTAACWSPQRVLLAGTWRDVSVASGAGTVTCATGDAGLRCWGSTHNAARLATNCAGCAGASIPATLSGPLDLGSNHGCALDAQGTAYCWGGNSAGELGTTIPPAFCRTSLCNASSGALPVATNERFDDVVTGDQFSCGLTGDGRVLCWGAYLRYAGAEGDRRPGPVPVAPDASLRFTTIAAGLGHVCGISTSNELYCWGDAAYAGALGEPVLPYQTVVAEPRLIAAGTSFESVAVGDQTTCAIRSDGPTVCIGEGSSLGQSGWINVPVTTPIPLMPPGPVPSWMSQSAHY